MTMLSGFAQDFAGVVGLGGGSGARLGRHGPKEERDIPLSDFFEIGIPSLDKSDPTVGIDGRAMEVVG